MLGNAEGARSTREGKGKLALLAFPYSYTARPELLKRRLRRLAQTSVSHERQPEVNCSFCWTVSATCLGLEKSCFDVW